MERGDRIDPFAGLKDTNQEYNVYDSHYERIGQVDDLLTDEDGQVLYIGVKMGFLGANSTLVPVEIIRINDKRHLIEVSEPAETIRHAPHFGNSEELTPELENHVRTYFGLETLRPSPEHDPQGPDIPEDFSDRGDRVDTVPDERAESLGPDILDSEQHRETTPETSEPVETDPQERAPERAPERAGSDEPISERLSHEPSLQERLTSGSGVTVHRIRR